MNDALNEIKGDAEVSEGADEALECQTSGTPPDGDGATETETLQADIAALNDRLLRLQADFENFRKRSQRERLDLRRQILEEVLSDLLPVMDHLEMGLEAATRAGISNSVRVGFEAVHAQFTEALKRWGVEEIDAIARPFDPHQHEAVAHEVAKNVAPDTVVRVLRKGYRIGDRLLRAAQVIVAAEEPVGQGHSETGDHA